MNVDAPEMTATDDHIGFVTTARLSRVSGVGQKTLQRKILKGFIRAVKFGPTYAVPADEVKRLFPGVHI